MSESLPYLLIIVAAGVIIFFIWRIRTSAAIAEVDDGLTMPAASRRILVGYLLAFGVFLVYMLVSLNSVDFPETAFMLEPPPIPSPSPTPTPPTLPGATTSPTPSPTPTPETPALFRVFPQSSVSSPPTVSLTLYGRNFKADSEVRINSKKAKKELISPDLIEAELEPTHLVSAGSITVDVKNSDGLLSNAIRVPVKRPIVPLNVFGWRPWISREVQLLLLAIFAGALGSYLHSIMSLADYIGNRTLTASWFWWYITRPFLGAAMSLVFYAVLRGGFLAGSPADAKVVNAFGVLAIGALVGMFADKAAQKLKEIFDIVFRAADTRTGKLNAPVITKLDPPTVPVNPTMPVTVRIIGERMGKVASVRLNAEDRKPDTVSETELTLKLKPEDTAKPGKIQISAVNPDGGVSTAATLHISDLTISAPAALPDARANTDYRQQITATGGAGSNQWSLVESPKWLSISDTGELNGTPGNADVKDTNKVTVKVVDAEDASASQSFNLKVIA